jgi:hypothetical protein
MNIGYLHEKNHPESWVIAMDENPSKYRILDYGMGSSACFRISRVAVFSITDIHVRKTDRLVGKINIILPSNEIFVLYYSLFYLSFSHTLWMFL